jgi:hypothetical protein
LRVSPFGVEEEEELAFVAEGLAATAATQAEVLDDANACTNAAAMATANGSPVQEVDTSHVPTETTLFLHGATSRNGVTRQATFTCGSSVVMVKRPSPISSATCAPESESSGVSS